MRLAGTHAVVTGGASGIGAAIARALAGEGAKLTLVGRRAEVLEALAAEIGATAASADASDRAALEAALAKGRAANGPFTIAVANAGKATSTPIARESISALRGLMQANLETTFNLIQATLPDLREAANGRIVAVASTAALSGYAYTSAYAASKHAVLGLIRSIALELAKTDITANALCPGFTDTAIVAEAVANITAKTGRDDAAARAELAAFNPQCRLIRPEEVASAALWLCLPESGSITGQAIAIAGGETL